MAEAGPEGVHEVKPKRTKRKATQGPASGDHAIGSASLEILMFLWWLFFNWIFFSNFFLASYCTSFRSSEWSCTPLKSWWIIAFTASDSLSCLFQEGSCRERGEEQISNHDQKLVCSVFFNKSIKCLLIMPRLKLYLIIWDLPVINIIVLGCDSLMKMLISPGHNCSGSAITVLHSRLVSQSICSFLPHSELICESCASVWRS